MSLSFSYCGPYNSLSMGTVSVSLTRELFKRGELPCIFPIYGQPPDLSAQVHDQEFNQKLDACVLSAPQRHSRKNPALMQWHINGALDSYSEKGNHLLTYLETDTLTPTETNVLRQQAKVYVTSRFTASMMAQYGIQAEYVPLGFDSHNFKQLGTRPKIDGVVQFFLPGKLEARKNHMQVLSAWAKRFGNDKAYRLNCAVHNPFLPPERMNAMINQALGGKPYWNIFFHPWQNDNGSYNSLIQSSEIVISMSGGEGRDLPCYHATALGAWPVAMKAHAYLDYLTDENAVLVSPNGKRPAADGVHFAPSGPYNQGNFFTVSDEEFIKGCEKAVENVKTKGLNTAGMELQKKGYGEAVDIILKDLSQAQ